jgi:hypothetical protein
MGKIKQGILGGFSGKVANVVGSSWKGIAVMKSLPLSVANPRTSAQVAQRTKFSNVVVCASSILSSVVKPLWDRFAQKMSGFNDFVRTNIDLFAGTSPSVFADFVISQGIMAKTPITEAFATIGEDDVSISWDDTDLSGYKLADDKAYLLALTSNSPKTFFMNLDKIRSQGSATVDLPFDLIDGTVCHLYLAFARADGTIVSDTAYLEAPAVAG